VTRNSYRPESWNNGKVWTGPIQVGNWNTTLQRRLQVWQPDELAETAVAASRSSINTFGNEWCLKSSQLMYMAFMSFAKARRE
jgi:hypothetical protein